MIANINQHVNKVERVDRSSPAAPLPIPVRSYQLKAILALIF
jgi:hypothetical protein